MRSNFLSGNMRPLKKFHWWTLSNRLLKKKNSNSFQAFKWLAKQPRLFLLQCPSFPGLKVLIPGLLHAITGTCWGQCLWKVPGFPEQPLWYLGINLTSLTTSSAIKEKINNSQMCCLEPHRINTVILPSSGVISLPFLQPSKFTFPKGILWPAPRHLTPDQEIQTRNISSSATLKSFKRFFFFCLADKIYFGPCCFSPTTLL